MKFLSVLWGAALVLASLAGCGGGGGGGGGGIPFIPVAPAAPLTVSVKINGSATTAQGSDSYAVKPGDTVEITPSKDANWTSGADSAGVTLRNPEIAPSKWSAQLVNGTTGEITYKVTASAGAEASQTKQLSLVVAGGDARNGSYRLYATNGSRQMLALNFDLGRYELTDDANATVSDAFSADANEAGTYVFKSSRITAAANTARFRLTEDVVIGAFPFALAQVTPAAYAVRPFIASRALVKTQAALDGTYNRFGIDLTASTANSNIMQMQISGGGTTLLQCRANNIYRVDNCPSDALFTFTVSPGPTDDMWRLEEVGNPSNNGLFAIARIGGQNVYLSAGKQPSAPATSVFRVGLPESVDWPTGTGHGSSTKGSWGKATVASSTSSSRIATTIDGATDTRTNVLTSMGTVDGHLRPLAMRQVTNGASGEFYFAMQGARIFAIVGAANPVTGGYLQLNLMD